MLDSGSANGLSSVTDGLEDAGGPMMSGSGFGAKLLPGTRYHMRADAIPFS